MAEEQKKQKNTRKDDNVIYVGKKPTMNYVLAVMTQFSEGAKEVQLKARGRSISRVVDVAEVIKNKFMQDVKRDIEIGTEQIQDEKGKLNVSTINIKFHK